MLRPIRESGLVLLLALVGALSAVSPAAAARGVRETNLDNRYPNGDYSLFVGWHDPQDWQFEEHGTSAWPLGLKIRVRWPHGLRIEGDLSYYRTSGPTNISISSLSVPKFDGLIVTSTLQWTTPRKGPVRPYVGGGPVFVSLSNDFPVIRTDIRDVDPLNVDQRTLARWSKYDFGAQVLVGVDLLPGARAFPFIEYRHIFGHLTLEDSDVKIGSFSLPSLNSELGIEDLETLPTDSTEGATGRKYTRRYDWSGPIVTVGLKIRF